MRLSLQRLNVDVQERIAALANQFSEDAVSSTSGVESRQLALLIRIERLFVILRMIALIAGIVLTPFLNVENMPAMYMIFCCFLLDNVITGAYIIPLHPSWLKGGFYRFTIECFFIGAAVAATGGSKSILAFIYFPLLAIHCLRFGNIQLGYGPLVATVTYAGGVLFGGGDPVGNIGLVGFYYVWLQLTAFVLTLVVRRGRTAEHRLEGELRRTRALLQAAHAPATSLTVNGVVEATVAQSRLLTGADVAAILLYRREGQPSVFRAVGEESAPAGAFVHMIRSSAPTRRVLLKTQSPVPPAVLMSDSPSAPGGVAQFASVCAAPIPGRRGHVGLVAVAHRHESGLNPVHYEALTAFLERAALALQNARLYEQLQAQVEELRSLHSQIVRAERLAALGELAAKVAHELNNPLTSIHLYSSLLLEEVADPAEQRRLAAIMLEQTERAKQVVRDILDYSRPTVPKLELASLNVTVESGLRLVRHVAHAAHVSIIEDYAGSLPPVRVDLGQMAQICTNLALNAIQAMANGGTLIISTGMQDDSLYVSFKDNGSGIPPEHLARVFEPFFTTKPAGQGTGLGLAVCRSLAMQQHGRLTVESEVGKGSTFTLWLPPAPSQEGMIAGPHAG